MYNKEESFQSGFIQKHSITHALIHLTEKIVNRWTMVIFVEAFC